MMFILWEEKYRTGIKSIDDQHGYLFSIVNRLHDTMTKGESRKVAGELLGELVECTTAHFSDEEKYMEQYGYPNYTDHKKEHEELAKQLAEVFNNCSSGKAILSAPIMRFLKGWLCEHILKEDLLYANFLIDKGLIPTNKAKKKTLKNIL